MKTVLQRISIPVSIIATVAVALFIFNCGGGGGGNGDGGGSLNATRVPGDYSSVGNLVTDGTWLAWIAEEKAKVMNHAGGSGADTGSAVTAVASDDWYANNIAYDGRYLVVEVIDGSDAEIIYYDTVAGGSYVTVTDNSLDDYGPAVNDGVIVWYADDGDGNEVFYYDISNPGQGVVQLTNNAQSDRDAYIAGGKIAWYGGSGSDYEIYFYDINASAPTIVQVSNSPGLRSSSPEVDENGLVVWMTDEGSDTEIFYADMSLGAATFTPVQLTNDSVWNQDVHVDGGKIVWENFSTVNYCDINAGSGTTVVQVVSNGAGNFYPSISGDRIVWSGDGEIYSHVIGDPVDSSLRVTNSAWYDEEPAISGDVIVWAAYDDNDSDFVYRFDVSTSELIRLSDETYRSVSGGGLATSGGDTYWLSEGANYRLYSAPVDGSSPVRTVTPGDLEAYNVDIDDGVLAYQTYGDYFEIHYADLNAVSFTTVQITNGTDYSENPAISNGIIVWEEYVDAQSSYDIFYYDINAVAPTLVNVSSNVSEDDVDAQIDDGIITWKASDGNDDEIWSADISVGASTFVVTQVSDNGFDDYRPRIDNSVITWYGDDGDYEIYYADVSAGASTFTVEQLTDNAGDDRYPEIHDGVVVWEGEGTSGSDNEIWYADVITGGAPVAVELTSNDLRDRYPSINEGLITWYADGDDTDYEIYLYDLNAAAPEITQVTDNEVNERYPVSSGGTIVWRSTFAPWVMTP